MMTTGILFINCKNTDLRAIMSALSELYAWDMQDDSLLLYSCDPSEVLIISEITEFWGRSVNMYVADAKHPPYHFMEMAHLAIQLNANVYHIGEDTGAEAFCSNMGIDVTVLPLSQ
jgi:hypothetical protein